MMRQALSSADGMFSCSGQHDASRPLSCWKKKQTDTLWKSLIGPWRFSSFLEPCPFSTPATRVMSHLLVGRSNILVPFPSCQGGSRKPHSCIIRLFVLILDGDLSRRRQATRAWLWEVALVKSR